MKYTGNPSFKHQQIDKIGVLLTNLGTPEKPTKPALRRYLKEFLSDPRIVEVPKLIWWMILNLVILNIRPKRSAKAYQKVWTEQGSPLMIHTRNQADKVRKELQQIYGEEIVVEFAMRYGEPAMNKTLNDMLEKGVAKLLVLPLYPQYSASTTGSTFDAISADFIKRRRLPDFRFISHYHDFPSYIKALANKIEKHWQEHGKAEKILFSYHGIPKRYLTNGDPYHCECYKTSRLIAEYLKLDESKYLTTFQSRFGREEWLKPYTDHTLKSLAGEQGVKSVQIICPGFSSDCLETIEEVDIENREYFMSAGGEDYQYIPCLNSDDEHINLLVELIKENLQGWQLNNQPDLRHQQAVKFGVEK